MGLTLKNALQDVADKHAETIFEVRGRGLMLGMEFREDEVGELVVAQLLKRGVCVAYTLNNPRVLRFEPPLIIGAEQIEFVREALDGAVAETEELLASLV
jgi:putrescine aminotransferase